MSWFFLPQSCEWSGTFYAFCANKSVYVRGNNREIPFVVVVRVIRTGLYPCQLIVCDQFPGGGGGGALRCIGGLHLRYVFCGRRGLFLRPPHVREFVKEGYFFVPRYEVWGSKSPYNPQNIRGSDAKWLPKWLGFRVCCRHLLPLNMQRIIKSKVKVCIPVHQMSVFTLYIKNTFSGEVSGSCWLFSSHFSYALNEMKNQLLTFPNTSITLVIH